MMQIQLAGRDVSRETMSKLQQFADLLCKWNKKINLVSSAGMSDLWERHIVDSAQVFSYAPQGTGHWVDLGSGGGLPGIVCAVLAQDSLPECRFTLIESDHRKSAFLMTAARELALPLSVLTERAEAAAPQGADIVTARALAPLDQLLPLVMRHIAETGIAILPKGKNHAQELAAAQREWHFEATAHASLTDPLARLLVIKEITRV